MSFWNDIFIITFLAPTESVQCIKVYIYLKNRHFRRDINCYTRVMTTSESYSARQGYGNVVRSQIRLRHRQQHFWIPASEFSCERDAPRAFVAVARITRSLNIGCRQRRLYDSDFAVSHR